MGSNQIVFEHAQCTPLCRGTLGPLSHVCVVVQALARPCRPTCTARGRTAALALRSRSAFALWCRSTCNATHVRRLKWAQRRTQCIVGVRAGTCDTRPHMFPNAVRGTATHARACTDRPIGAAGCACAPHVGPHVQHATVGVRRGVSAVPAAHPSPIGTRRRRRIVRRMPIRRGGRRPRRPLCAPASAPPHTAHRQGRVGGGVRRLAQCTCASAASYCASCRGLHAATDSADRFGVSLHARAGLCGFGPAVRRSAALPPAVLDGHIGAA
jgi:hypothetical protein